MTEKSQGKDQRSFNGQLVNSYKQLRLTFIFIGGGLLAITGLTMLVLSNLRAQLLALDLAENIDPEVTYPLLASLQQAQILISIASLSIFGFAVWRGFLLSHRIWGPMVPLRRQVSELTKGNYSVRMKLREGDEFSELGADLNALAEALEIKHRAQQT